MSSWPRKSTTNPEGDRPHGPEGEPRRPERPTIPIRPRESVRIRRDVDGGSVSRPPPSHRPNPPSPAAKKQSSYHDLRKLALTAPRQEATGVNPKGSFEVWAAIMEIALAGATTTVAVFEDGTASVYLSSGGGFIGGGAHEKIRTAGKVFIACADEFLPQMTLTDAFPEPRPAEAIFYVRTDIGTFMAKEPKEELVKGRNVLSPLFAAAQEVIARYRLWEETRGK